jgi:hypothetical protein
MEYGVEIWGHIKCDSLNRVYLCAARSLLHVSKNAPEAAVVGDIGWTPTIVRHRIGLTRMWNRLCHLDSNRLTRRIFQWHLDRGLTWGSKVKAMFRELKRPFLCEIHNVILVGKQSVKKMILELSWENYKCSWTDKLNTNIARTGQGGNKLRTYRTFKKEICKEPYVYGFLNEHYRRCFAQFRMGIAPIKIETGRRVKGQYVPPIDRICPVCTLECENEEHVLIRCPAYVNLRSELFTKITDTMPNFVSFNDQEKLTCLLGDYNVFKLVAKFCFDILTCRQDCIECPSK